MGLDIRLPIGALLAVIGVVLVVYGVASDPAVYARSLGLNINVWWGGALVALGAVMLGLARRAKQ